MFLIVLAACQERAEATRDPVVDPASITAGSTDLWDRPPGGAGPGASQASGPRPTVPASTDDPVEPAPQVDTGVADDEVPEEDVPEEEVPEEEVPEEEVPEEEVPEAPPPAPPPVPPLVARVTADAVAGAYPLVVSFDASGSELGSGAVEYLWSFGDGAADEGAGGAAHTYVGEGSFLVSLTMTDEVTGEVSDAEVTVDVTAPTCPTVEPVLELGEVADGGLTELSGIGASRRVDGLWWVHEDSGQDPVLTAIDGAGGTVSEHELPDDFDDFEDLSVAVDPATGTSLLFLADIGDNGYSRDEVAVWVVDEPDPLVDGVLDPLRMALTYPDGPRNAETLLVDPLTLDLYIVTKESWGDASVFVKRAPHDAEGPFELEDLGAQETLGMTATGGDVSPDGSRVVVRDYTDTALMFFRDGYLPLEQAFEGTPCEIGIHSEFQGEAIGFDADGAGVVTVSEGAGPELYYIGL